jgi:hypothetical protein
MAYDQGGIIGRDGRYIRKIATVQRIKAEMSGVNGLGFAKTAGQDECPLRDPERSKRLTDNPIQVMILYGP